MRTCKKCSTQFQEINYSRICSDCRNTNCIDCGVDISDKRSDMVHCSKCKPKHAVKRSVNWYEENKDKKRVYDANRRIEKNHLYRQASKRFRDTNPAKKKADTISRRAGIKEQTPVWANLQYMNLFYEGAKIEEKRIGKKVHVDHIIPLNHKLVCGLHCEHNLQLLTAKENMRKGNHYSLTHNGSI